LIAHNRRFGVTVGGAFAALTLLLLWRDQRVAAGITAALAAGLVVAALVAPSSLTRVERGWMAMAHAISKVTTPIIMGIVYFVVVTPIGVAIRLFGKHPLRHGMFGSGFWLPREAERDRRGGMERQF
jgi:uncharacterized membrane protein